MQNKRYEILAGLPAYGPMYKSIPNSGKNIYSEGFVVRFFKDDGTDWVANFTGKEGMDRQPEIIELPKKRFLLIIVQGCVYILDPNFETPIDKVSVDLDAIYFASKDRTILQDYLSNFKVIEADGIIWETESISNDGFDEIKVEDNIVSGKAYNEMGSSAFEFSNNIDSKELTRKT